MEVEGCGGQCCAVFPWGTRPARMREVWEEAPGADWEVGQWANGIDQLMIADMLIPLTREQAEERAARFGIRDDFVGRALADGRDLYTCKNWNEETRACGVYDARPDMCATYPYAAPCFHCTADGGCKEQTGWRRRLEQDDQKKDQDDDADTDVHDFSLVEVLAEGDVLET